MGVALVLMGAGFATRDGAAEASQPTLPEAPSAVLGLQPAPEPAKGGYSSSFSGFSAAPIAPFAWQTTPPASPEKPGQEPGGRSTEVDKNGEPIPLERQQPKRILGFMPNFRSVSGGAVPHPPGFTYNFKVATHQAFDYSSFIFLGLTSITAEGMDSHPALGKGVGGFWGYTWRGFVDKTDGTYLSAWLLPSILHEDTRYYGLGRGSILKRSLYVISRQAVARTYGGRDTPNIAGLGGKVLTQVISRQYYPTTATSFSVLATKFGYSVMRDVAFSSIREFYPTVAAHYVRKHRAQQLKLQQRQQAAPATAPQP